MNNRNANVDYLVSIGDEKLILIELKTTNDSFSEAQKDRMKNAVNAGAEELLRFYKKIADCPNFKGILKRKFNLNDVYIQVIPDNFRHYACYGQDSSIK